MNEQLNQLTEKLHATADNKLKDKIEEAAGPLALYLNTGQRHDVDLGGAPVNVFLALDAIKRKAFEIRRDRNRTDAINEFVAKMNEKEFKPV